MSGPSVITFSDHLIQLYLLNVKVLAKAGVLEAFEVTTLFIYFGCAMENIHICVEQGDGQIISYRTKSSDTDYKFCPKARALIDENSTIEMVNISIFYQSPGIYTLRVKVSHHNTLLISKVIKLTVIDQPSVAKRKVDFVDKRLSQRLQPMTLLSNEQYTVQYEFTHANEIQFHKHLYDLQVRTEDTTESQLIAEVNSTTRPIFVIEPQSMPSGLNSITLLERQKKRNNTLIKVPLLVGYFLIIPAPLNIRLLNTSMSRIRISKGTSDLCLRPELYTVIELCGNKSQVCVFQEIGLVCRRSLNGR